MSHRRDFLKGSMATAAIAVSGSYSIADAQHFVAIDKSIKPLPVTLNSDEYNSFEAFLSSSDFHTHKDLLNLQNRHLLGTNGWPAENIQMHTRYVPSIDGASLEAPIVKKNKDLNLIHRYGSNALQVNTTPCGVIINRSKAKRYKIETFSLSHFCAKNVKPHFPLNSSASSPENSWLMTSLTDAGVIGRTLQGSFIKKRKTIETFIENYALNLELPCFHSHSIKQLYVDLINEKTDTVAIYGSPEELLSFLDETHNKDHRLNKFAVLSLQDFLKIKTPSFFPSRFLQAGISLNHPLTSDIISLMTGYFLSEPYVKNKNISSGYTRTTKILNKVNKELEANHNSAYFKNLMGLEYLTDGGFLVNFMLDIASGIDFHGKASGSNLVAISNYAASEAQNRWGDYQSNNKLSIT